MTSQTAMQAKPATVNGLDLEALASVVEEIKQDPAKGIVAFHVSSAWQGQTRSETSVESYTIGGEEVPRRFKIAVDEPFELLGQNTAPNPQEMLMTALNACMMVGYVAGAAVKGITLESLEIETYGNLDLRGFLGIDAAVKPGYDSILFTVRIKGDGSEEEFRDIHETVMRTSPNYFNVSRPIRLDGHLKVES
ncbi:OsmC family protein [Pelagibius sp.]|uniref:OsmC family protein n=1 Tax=Pelagibius sp. TaxID=1931238 RepID=UPI00260304B9|nr:OsmC family protein [Pelagibius sp.]